MLDQIGYVHERLQSHDVELRDLRRRVEAVTVGNSLRADAIEGIIPAANAPVNWFYNGNLLGAGTRADFIEAAGIWISGTFLAGRAYYLIGAYPADEPPISISGVDFAANGDPLCFGAGLNLQEQSGVWISGTCADGQATFHIGATAGGGGGGDAIEDADADTGVYTEENPDEDIIRFKIAGVNDVMTLQASGLDLNAHAAIGADAALSASCVVVIQETIGAGAFGGHGGYIDVGYAGDEVGTALYGLWLYSRNQTVVPGTMSVLYGLGFIAQHESARPLSKAYGINASIRSSAAGSGPWTQALGFQIAGSYAGAKPGTVNAVMIVASVAPAGVTTAYGFQCADLLATTAYLAELGPATPYFRVVGGAAPAANQTNQYLNEGGNLRQVQWVDPGAGGANLVAGQRVMILV